MYVMEIMFPKGILLEIKLLHVALLFTFKNCAKCVVVEAFALIADIRTVNKIFLVCLSSICSITLRIASI